MHGLISCLQPFFCALQGLSLTPASFSLTAGAGANASIAGITNVTNSAVADVYTYIAEVQVNSSYQVSLKALADDTEQPHRYCTVASLRQS